LESELDRLNRQLQEERAGPNQNELAQLEANVLVAQEALDQAESDLADAEEGVDQLKLAQLEAATDSSQLALESAQARLDRLEEGIDQTVLADLAQSVVAAREARDELADGPDLAAVELAQANVDAAKIDYAEIQEDLAKSELRAPFSGLVSLVTIEPDDIITVDARVIRLVDPNDVSVLGMVETNHIDRIDVGTPAAVTLGALPGVTFHATVQEKSGDARTERGVISFPVTFRVAIPPDVSVPPNPGLVTTTILAGTGEPPGRRGG
jgi:multidrug resistance efflux pump